MGVRVSTSDKPSETGPPSHSHTPDTQSHLSFFPASPPATFLSALSLLAIRPNTTATNDSGNAVSNPTRRKTRVDRRLDYICVACTAYRKRIHSSFLDASLVAPLRPLSFAATLPNTTAINDSGSAIIMPSMTPAPKPRASSASQHLSRLGVGIDMRSTHSYTPDGFTRLSSTPHQPPSPPSPSSPPSPKPPSPPPPAAPS